WVARHISVRGQIVVHIALLAISVSVLPVQPSEFWKRLAAGYPIWGVLGILLISVGLPYFLLSTTGPMVQAWYARGKVSFPYRLFAISNLASLGALLAYPVAIEPYFSTSRQMLAWSAGYLLFVILAGAAALASRSPALWTAPAEQSPGIGDRILWIALA